MPTRSTLIHCTTGLAALAAALAVAQGATPASVGGPRGTIAVVGDGSLYVVGASDARRRLLAPFAVTFAAWSRDRRRLGYVGYSVGYSAIGLALPRGRVIARVGSPFTEGFTWAPDGRRLTYAAHPAVAGTARLVVAGGGVRPRVLDPRAAAYQVPQWSRRNAIAYLKPAEDSEAAIWVARPDGGGRHLVERGVADDGTSLSWSPDGKRLAFVRAADADGNATLAVVGPGGKRARTVATVSAGDETTPIRDVRWSPAGGEIAYLRSVGPTPNTELCLADAGGGGDRVVASAPFMDDLTWSPDGRWLAYLVEDPNTPSGVPMSIWLVRSDGSGNHRLTRFRELVYGLAWGG